MIDRDISFHRFALNWQIRLTRLGPYAVQIQEIFLRLVCGRLRLVNLWQKSVKPKGPDLGLLLSFACHSSSLTHCSFPERKQRFWEVMGRMKLMSFIGEWVCRFWLHKVIVVLKFSLNLCFDNVDEFVVSIFQDPEDFVATIFHVCTWLFEELSVKLAFLFFRGVLYLHIS